MDSVTGTPTTVAGPTADRPPAREQSRAELVAELERVVSLAKTDSQQWQERADAVTDDLLPKRRG